MAYNPYRASYGLPPPILPSAGKPVPQGMTPMQPPVPPLKAPLHIQNPQPNMSESSNRSILSSRAESVLLEENFRPENLARNESPSVEEQMDAMKAFNLNRIKGIKGSRRAQQMLSSALTAAGGSPSAPESSPSKTIASNPRSKNGSTESLFGGISPIATVENTRKRKIRKARKARKARSRKLKNRRSK